MMKRDRKSFLRAFAVFAAAVALILAFSVTAFAAGVVYTDVDGHWAEATIDRAAAEGLDMLTGDKFYPDDAITREEFSYMVSWAFGLETAAKDITFKDVPASDPYREAILKGVYSDILHGRSASYFDPKTNITRQEACVIFDQMLPLYGVPATGVVEKFKDYSDISSWALDAVGTIASAGYIVGYPDNTVRPLNNITKAEALIMIMNIVDHSTIVHGDFTAKDGQVFKDTIYTGTITVPAGAEVTFDNCSILGKLRSLTTEPKTKWELPHDTKVANVEYAKESSGGGSTPTPTPTPTPEPDDGDNPGFTYTSDPE